MMPLRARSFPVEPLQVVVQAGPGARRGPGEARACNPFLTRAAVPQGAMRFSALPDHGAPQHPCSGPGAHLQWASQRDTERDVWGGQVMCFILDMVPIVLQTAAVAAMRSQLPSQTCPMPSTPGYRYFQGEPLQPCEKAGKGRPSRSEHSEMSWWEGSDGDGDWKGRRGTAAACWANARHTTFHTFPATMQN